MLDKRLCLLNINGVVLLFYQIYRACRPLLMLHEAYTAAQPVAFLLNLLLGFSWEADTHWMDAVYCQ